MDSTGKTFIESYVILDVFIIVTAVLAQSDRAYKEKTFLSGAVHG